MHVLDTTHPQAIRRLADRSTSAGRCSSPRRSRARRSRRAPTSSSSGSGPAATRSSSSAITDPGSALGALAAERGFRATFAGEPTIGGRYSALSAFGLVPAALMGVDLARLLERTQEMLEACHLEEGNPGLDLGRALGEGWREGRDKVVLNPNPGGFGLWVEQLIAESTGKHGKGLVPAPGEGEDGRDRQAHEVRVPTRTSSARSSSAGSSPSRSPARSSRSTPSTSRTCRPRRTRRTRCSRAATSRSSPRARSTSCWTTPRRRSTSRSRRSSTLRARRSSSR